MPLLTRLLDQLDSLGEIEDRTHLGGWALYRHGRMFALVQGDRVWLRTDASNRFDYQRRGMVAFSPNPGMELGAFFEVPPNVLADSDQLLAWARKAVATR
jgi:DNA transformation protein and related proteins